MNYSQELFNDMIRFIRINEDDHELLESAFGDGSKEKLLSGFYNFEYLKERYARYLENNTLKKVVYDKSMAKEWARVTGYLKENCDYLNKIPIVCATGARK